MGQESDVCCTTSMYDIQNRCIPDEIDLFYFKTCIITHNNNVIEQNINVSMFDILSVKEPHSLKIPLTSMCVVVRTPSPGPDFVNSSPPTHPLNWSFNPSKKLSLQPVLKSFITVFIQCNVGLEDKLIRAPLLGLAKSIYYGPVHKFLFYLWQSRIDFQLIIKYIAVHVRHFCEGVRIFVLTAHV